MKIMKVYREYIPGVRLIGKRYTDADRKDEGGYAHKWKEWFDQNTAKTFVEMESLPGYEDVMIGAMYCKEEFEYWIGMFFPPETEVPEGFDYADLPKSDLGTCWLYGKESTGELYGPEPHHACMEALKKKGWDPKEEGWTFERYHCPRFTNEDGKGNVILDYCAHLKEE